MDFALVIIILPMSSNHIKHTGILNRVIRDIQPEDDLSYLSKGGKSLGKFKVTLLINTGQRAKQIEDLLLLHSVKEGCTYLIVYM